MSARTLAVLFVVRAGAGTLAIHTIAALAAAIDAEGAGERDVVHAKLQEACDLAEDLLAKLEAAEAELWIAPRGPNAESGDAA